MTHNVESNEQTELIRKVLTDPHTESRIRGGEDGLEVKGQKKKEKGLLDVYNRVVIAEGSGIRGLNGNGKNTIKKKKCLGYDPEHTHSLHHTLVVYVCAYIYIFTYAQIQSIFFKK